MAKCDLCLNTIKGLGNHSHKFMFNYQTYIYTLCDTCEEDMCLAEAKNAEAYERVVKKGTALNFGSPQARLFAMWKNMMEPERRAREEAEQKAREEAERKEIEKERIKEKIPNIIVTTGDLKQNYDVIGPVYFQVSNKGLFGSALSHLVTKYSSQIQQMKSDGQLSQERADWGFLYGEWSVGQNDFDKAFYVATQELKARAAMLGADAVICMRQDIDLDTNGFTYFYLQMYGTAVKIKE